MKGLSTSPVRRNDGFHRYLKPGALAQIRNTRLNTRSNSSLALSLPSRVDPPDATPTTMDQMPDLLSKIYGGPFRIGRKKLGPARSVLRTMLDLNPPSPNSTLESTSNGNNNVLSIVDVLVAH
ncbi:hypothetical protein BRARA_H01535 [Brassica rapa]|uniref:Uncharacterized protein n=2 Tax=Brassica campestris TaxID=3711 RepID=M4D1S1_BRACM|nr:uncharacterized protein LOC103834827 [Brassica rapa]KAG5390026.1 hypothetical protein IGI04_031567 [Brassica rapa subsp. trilocularis]RID50833.1 hypothetical protein BRARA_H01535 [Brassica rapa]